MPQSVGANLKVRPYTQSLKPYDAGFTFEHIAPEKSHIFSRLIDILDIVYFVTLSGSEGPRFFALLRMTIGSC